MFKREGFSIIDAILKVVTYLLLLSLVIVYITPYFHPKYFTILSLLGLFAPIIIGLNLILGIYWVLRWNRIAIISFLAIVLGIGQIAKLVQVPVLKDNNQTKGSTLKIMTFNAHYFTNPEHKNVLQETLQTIDTMKLDIICFQEFVTPQQNILDEINNTLKDFPYRYINSQKDAKAKMSGFSAIYSKYRIVNRNSIIFANKVNTSMYVDILYRSDTIRVMNNHLQTNSINPVDVQFLSGDLDKNSKDDNFFRLFSIAGKIMANNKIRGNQADTVASTIENTPYTIIVCGDHNVIPTSYEYNTIRGDLADSFMEKGSWYGSTYKLFSRMLRIDYLFHSNKFETVNYSSPNILWSDHKPVIVELKYNK